MTRLDDPRGMAARIRAAARALFLAHGYGGTSMDAVAAAAPASKRTLYQYYPGKADLFAAVIAEVWSEFTDAPALPDSAEEKADTVLAAFVGRMTAHWDRPEVIAFLRLIIAETTRFPEISEAYFRSGKEPALRGLTTYLERLIQAGQLPAALDSRLAAAQFLGAIKEPLFWPRVLGVPVTFSVEEATRRAIDGLLGERREA